MRVGVAGLTLLTLLVPGLALAQPPVRPAADWRTLETEHFVVHYPAELAAWTEPMVRRLEAIHDAVSEAVGFEPAGPTTLIVDDPGGQSNGVSFGPVIYLWPSPPGPTSEIGENRGWSEMLTVHEYAHSAHLMRPTRNPLDRVLYSLFPFPVPPLAVRTPRWAIEGYATYLEGKLTGSGRPNGTWRPAVLRKWALEGKLPRYDELNRRDGEWEGSMAYLAGSAFAEWLVDRKGEDALRDLWARMTARQRRSFGDAFAGVFGGPPDELYAEFTVDVTGKALTARTGLRSAGIVAGEMFQRMGTITADPAASPDGEVLAITISPAHRPSRIVLWSTAPDTAAARREREERERMLAADPEDVPAIDWRPRPREPLATLGPIGGRGHRAPRFLPDGERLLVVRTEGLGDGRARGDLFAWTWRTGEMSRITRGAGIRSADPTPDGRAAIADRCVNGICDLVRVDLETGAVELVAPGAPDAPFFRPRVSPDGTRVAASVQTAAGWRTAIVDIVGGEPAGVFLGAPAGPMGFVGPDDGASRFAAAWLPGGDALVAVSEAGGVHDIERIDLATGAARPLTRVVGAAMAPEPDPAGRWVWFLTLESRGNDVRRIEADAAPLDPAPALDPALAPAAPKDPPAGTSFAMAELPAARSYGMGPRHLTLLPRGSIASSGTAAGLTLAGTDPVGRFVWTLDGLVGTDDAWRGVAASAAYRRFPPEILATVFAAWQEPSEQDDLRPSGLDADYAGIGVAVALERDLFSRAARFELGGSAGRLDTSLTPDGTRALGYAEASLRTLASPGRWRLTGAAELNASAGSTPGGDGWRRAVSGVSLAVGRDRGALRLESVHGWISDDAPLWETFSAGGPVSPLVDPSLLSQRLPLPAVPVGYVAGERIWTVRVEGRTSAGVVPFWWAGTAGDELGDWKRVWGIEWRLTRDAIPYLGLPASRLEAGVARIMDEPLRHATRGWLSLSFRP
ncbi:MAG TPA: hypothetical protein VFM44_06900 [Gemmatimonadota bacterium]|nr:hypothetical protein [Gemmatimonadota bacterium]